MSFKDGSQVPLAVAAVVQATAITTQTGVNVTINGGTQGLGTQGQNAGAYYGMQVVSPSGTCTYTPYSILGTSTTQLAPAGQPSAVGAICSPGPAGIGVQYLGALVVTVSGAGAGTGSTNVLWD